MVSASDLGPEGQEFERWPVHPRCVLRQNTSGGSRNTPSRFILQKPEISAGTDEPSDSPNYDWESF